MAALISSGRPAPDFILRDLEAETHRLSDQRGHVVVLNFWSAVCPWSRRADEALGETLQDWGDRVVYWLIASNSDEMVEMIREAASMRGLSLVLHDIDHLVADLYEAVTTPQFFVIDPEGILRYSGALDDVTFRNRSPSRAYLIEAVNAVFAGQQPEPAQTPAYGCALVRATEDAGQSAG
jgi:peroxiredoxin